MAQVVTQNDLVDIINSYNRSIEELVAFAENAAKLCVEVKKLNSKSFSKSIKSISECVNDLNKVIKRIIDIKIDDAVISKKIEVIKNTISSFSEILKLIGDIDAPGFFEKYKNIIVLKKISKHIRKVMRVILKQFEALYDEMMEHAKIMVKIRMVRSVFDSIKHILECFEIFSIKRLMQVFIQSKLVKYFMVFILDTIKNIYETLNSREDFNTHIKGIAIKLFLLLMIMDMIKRTIDEIINLNILKILILQKLYEKKIEFVTSFIVKIMEMFKPIEDIAVNMKEAAKKMLLFLVTVKLLYYVVLSLKMLNGLGRRKSNKIISVVKNTINVIVKMIEVIDGADIKKIDNCTKNIEKITNFIDLLLKLFLKVITVSGLGIALIINIAWLYAGTIALKLLITLIIKTFGKSKTNILKRVIETFELINDIVDELIKVFGKIVAIDYLNKDIFKQIGKLVLAVIALKVFTYILMILFAKTKINILKKIKDNLDVINSIVNELSALFLKITGAAFVIKKFILMMMFFIIGVAMLRLFLEVIYVALGNVKAGVLMKLKRNLNLITGIFTDLLVIFGEASFMAILAPLVIVSLILCTLAVLALRVFMLVLQWLFSSIKWGKLYKNMMYMIGFFFLFMILSFIVLGITIPAIVVAKHAKELGIFMLIMVGILVAILLIGALLAIVSSYTSIMLVGWGVMLLMVFMVFLIALMLERIAKVDLDAAAIQEKVKNILSICSDITFAIFSSKDEEAKKTNKSWIKSVIEYAGSAFTHIIGAILSVAYLACMIVSILFIWLIAGMLKEIQELDLNDAQILSNVNTILEICSHISLTIFGTDEEKSKTSDKSWIQSVVEFVAPTFMHIIGAVLSIAYLACLVVSILFIWLIAGMLKEIQEIDLNEELVKAKVDSILTTCLNISNHIFKDEDKTQKKSEGDGLITKIGAFLEENVGGFFKGFLNVAKALVSYIYFAQLLSVVLLVYFLGSLLQKIVDFAFQEANVKTKVDSIFSCGEIIMIKLANMKEYDVDDDVLDDMEDIVEELVDVAECLAEIAEFKIYDLQKAFIKNSIDAAVYCIDALNGKSINNVKLNHLKGVTGCIIELHKNIDYSDKTAKNFKSITDDGVKFINKVNSADLDKLQTAVNLFKQLAEFSKSIDGNFEALADALNEKIAPLLERLQEQIDNLNSTVQITAADTQEAMYDSSISSMEVQSGNNGPLTGFLTDLFKSDDSGYDKASGYRKRMNDLASKYRTSNNWDTLYAILTEEGVRTT